MEGSKLSDSVVFKVLHFWWRLCTAIFLYTETMKDTEFSRLRSHLKPSWKFVGFSDYQRQVSWEKPFCNLTSLHPRLRDQLVCEAGFEAPPPKISYLAPVCQRLIWRGLDGNQSRVQPAKIARIARIAAGEKSEKARSQVSKLGVTCPLFALLPDRNIPLWTDQTPMKTTMNIKN